MTETGKELKHPKLLLPNSDICVRLDSLGPGYGLDDFYKRVIENTVIAADPFRELEEQPSTEKINRYTRRLEKAGFRVIITYHCLQLRSCKYKRKYREYSSVILQEVYA